MSWAIQIIVAAALTAGSVLFVTETREREPETLPVEEVIEEQDTVGHLSNSLRILGACSVATSLVGGLTLITITKLRKKGQP